MAKSKYDRNMDRGAAQQRRPRPEGQENFNKPGAPAEDPAEPAQPGGGSKKQGVPGKRNHESSWRPKPTGGDNR